MDEESPPSSALAKSKEKPEAQQARQEKMQEKERAKRKERQELIRQTLERGEPPPDLPSHRLRQRFQTTLCQRDQKRRESESKSGIQLSHMNTFFTFQNSFVSDMKNAPSEFRTGLRAIYAGDMSAHDTTRHDGLRLRITGALRLAVSRVRRSMSEPRTRPVGLDARLNQWFCCVLQTLSKPGFYHACSAKYASDLYERTRSASFDGITTGTFKVSGVVELRVRR
ncbi:hypothetical protein BCR34DRAFT_612047 [Clohesyomyces aquaticus]|uniref:Uncharacterized protein n=1 Tax=Clohesyomyces aquaticus TaxID=1231657 RepID=A0A1Y1ZZ78_9PLEO|nr:hypothetical protein BCR34DRAFT_612047 [Clohesyomyces aquaticus]